VIAPIHEITLKEIVPNGLILPYCDKCGEVPKQIIKRFEEDDVFILNKKNKYEELADSCVFYERVFLCRRCGKELEIDDDAEGQLGLI
jgi:hypothetical protein